MPDAFMNKSLAFSHDVSSGRLCVKIFTELLRRILSAWVNCAYIAYFFFFFIRVSSQVAVKINIHV